MARMLLQKGQNLKSPHPNKPKPRHHPSQLTTCFTVDAMFALGKIACTLQVRELNESFLPTGAITVPFWDKAQHALGFSGLAPLGLPAYPGRTRQLTFGLMLLGAGIECAQALTGWRQQMATSTFRSYR
jgi:hypothetical protein